MNINVTSNEMAQAMPRLVEWKNGPRATGTFSSAEMDARQSSLRALMVDADLDACLLTSYHNICYYADFLYCQFGRRYGLVVTHDKATSISAGIDGGQPWRRTHGDNVIYTDWRRDNYFHAVRELTPGVRRLGHRIRPREPRFQAPARRGAAGS